MTQSGFAGWGPADRQVGAQSGFFLGGGEWRPADTEVGAQCAFGVLTG